MNIAEAVMKADEGKFLTDLASAPITTIQGIGPKSEAILSALGVKTVEDLATYKYFLLARSLATLAETEDKRPEGSVMNVDKAMDKDFESKTLPSAPLRASQRRLKSSLQNSESRPSVTWQRGSTAAGRKPLFTHPSTKKPGRPSSARQTLLSRNCLEGPWASVSGVLRTQ